MAEEVNFENTVMGKITKDALINWNQLSEEEANKKVSEMGSAEKANAEVTYGSELSSISGIANILGLSKDEIETMTSDIYTREAVSQELANKVKTKMEERGMNSSIIDVLSVIHDGWVKDNGNKFEDPKRMKKLYQFVDLKLLNFGEAKADLLFLKPILEASGITVDEVALEQEFLKEQKEFLEEKGITNKSELQDYLKNGSKSYSALEGVTTTKGKTAEKELITDRLQDTQILEEMTNQVAEKVNINEKAKIGVDQVQEVAEGLNRSNLENTEKDVIDEVKREKNNVKDNNDKNIEDEIK